MDICHTTSLLSTGRLYNCNHLTQVKEAIHKGGLSLLYDKIELDNRGSMHKNLAQKAFFCIKSYADNK